MAMGQQQAFSPSPGDKCKLALPEGVKLYLNKLPGEPFRIEEELKIDKRMSSENHSGEVDPDYLCTVEAVHESYLELIANHITNGEHAGVHISNRLFQKYFRRAPLG